MVLQNDYLSDRIFIYDADTYYYLRRTAYFTESPQNMRREYVRGDEYSDIEKPRELPSKVTDGHKLDILPQTKSKLVGK